MNRQKRWTALRLLSWNLRRATTLLRPCRWLSNRRNEIHPMVGYLALGILRARRTNRRAGPTRNGISSLYRGSSSRSRGESFRILWIFLSSSRRIATRGTRNSRPSFSSNSPSRGSFHRLARDISYKRHRHHGCHRERNHSTSATRCKRSKALAHDFNISDARLRLWRMLIRIRLQFRRFGFCNENILRCHCSLFVRRNVYRTFGLMYRSRNVTSSFLEKGTAFEVNCRHWF
jgi:hypothetical protein